MKTNNNNNVDKQNIINVYILGYENVGKTSITVQFICKQFYDSYETTVEHFHPTSIIVNDKQYKIQILDTVEKDETKESIDNNIKRNEAFILVYSITSKLSFDQIKLIRDRIINVKTGDDNYHQIPAMILVGNKLDLNKRQVTTQQGIELADSFGGIPFFEVSAIKNLDEIFISLTNEVILKRQQLQQQKDDNNNNKNNNNKSKNKCKIM